ncbi:MAG TPA: peptidylprolyl isomerase [Nevskia sp.]|nr:peptidylprolyl isomerase [Nevskia sp.]
MSLFQRFALLCLVSTLGLAAAGCATAPPPAPPPDPHPRVLLQTSQGNITLELDREHAPLSVDNFLAYVKEGRYDGTVFHRVVPGFVIQGGGYGPDLKDRPRHPPIPLESHNGLSNLRGTLAMARDTAPDTADAEFYINLVDNLKLNPHPEIPGREYGYAVFGRVVDGMEVVDRIAALPTHAVSEDFGNVPLETVLIRKAVLLPRGA